MPAEQQKRAKRNAHDGDALDGIRELFGEELFGKREQPGECSADNPEENPENGEF